MKDPIHILVIEGRYYHHLADALLLGAETALREAGATWEACDRARRARNPASACGGDRCGRLRRGLGEALSWRHRAWLRDPGRDDALRHRRGRIRSRVDGAGDAIGHPVGNGILTVENEAQAVARASVTGKNKGREAAEACLEVLRLNVSSAKDAADRRDWPTELKA